MAAAVPPSRRGRVPALTMMARDSAIADRARRGAGRGPAAAPPPPPGPAEALLWPVGGRGAAPLRRARRGRRAPPGHRRRPPRRSRWSRAPADAVVRYAGPFLEYGYVVVLEPDPETMLVLAGLARLQVRTGATVRRGDLLGLLGGRPPDVEEYVMLPEAETGAGAGETLYIEVRHGTGAGRSGTPVRRRERIGKRPMKKIWLAGIGGAVAGVVVSTQFAGADRGPGGREGEVGLRAARPLRRHLRAHPLLLRRAGGREGADRRRDQRHADAPRPAFELPAARTSSTTCGSRPRASSAASASR